MLFALLAASALLATSSSVRADSDTLADTLKLRLNQQAESTALATNLQCDNLAAQMCPTGVPPPSVTFNAVLSSVTGKTQGCCKGNYLACLVQVGTMQFKDMATYVIPVDQGNSEEVCDQTSPQCTCQLALATEKYLELKACPTSPDCCPQCACYGDPHCNSFLADVPSTIWAICDDRGSSCVHGPTTCAKTTYDGKTCVWDSQSKLCNPAPGTKKAEMVMYSKTYLPILNTSRGDKLTKFSVKLALTTYGSISTVTVVDGDITHVFTTGANSCSGTSRFPVVDNKVHIDGLPSGVIIDLECMSTGSGANHPNRWDVSSLKDPWFIENPVATIPGQKFGGYCPSGKIAEQVEPSTTTCRIVDRQLANYHGCGASSTITTCKSQFCQKHASKLTFPSKYTGTAIKKCQSYLSGVETGYLTASCAVSKLHSGSSSAVDVLNCMLDPQCKQCTDDLVDFPEFAATVLSTPRKATTSEPTPGCPPDLVQRGLSRKQLTVGSGIQIDALVGSVWQPKFALLDEELVHCGGCKGVVKISSSTPNALALLTPGQYRIRQGIAADSSADQNVCKGLLGYNATVNYFNPFHGGSAVSATFADLYNSEELVCSPTKFPKCPLNFQCCVWNRETQKLAWEDCMANNHGGVAKYPNCQKP